MEERNDEKGNKEVRYNKLIRMEGRRNIKEAKIVRMEEDVKCSEERRK